MARRPRPLSLMASLVADYVKLRHDPAQDWLRWVAEDTRHKDPPPRDVLRGPDRTVFAARVAVPPRPG
jgi:hypothetical protein